MSEIAQRKHRAFICSPRRPGQNLGRFRWALPLVVLAALTAWHCESDDNSDSRTVFALLVARQLGLQAIPPGSNCPTGDPSCPSATEGDLTIFPGIVAPGPATFEVTPSCRNCAVEVWGPSPNGGAALFLSAYVDEGGEPLVVQAPGSVTAATTIRVRRHTSESGWVPDTGATVRAIGGS